MRREVLWVYCHTRKEDDGKALFILNDPPNGTERIYNGIRLANTLLKGLLARATTPIHPDVLESILPWLRDGFGNPSSVHVYGRRARGAVDHAREQVAALPGCDPEEVYFTSGGTEANNLAILGIAAAVGAGRKSVVTSVVEHPATARHGKRAVHRGPGQGTRQTGCPTL
jgi:hypothetical protein